jgi:hypothetical protein
MGAISCFKEHLARILGHEGPNSCLEVMHTARQSVYEKDKKKKDETAL